MTNEQRVFVYALPKDHDIAHLQKHGRLVVLSDIYGHNRPAVWNTFETSRWLQQCLALQRYNPETDYVALVGNDLALVQFIASVVANGPQPYTIKALAFDRDQFRHVMIEECVHPVLKG